MTINVSKYALTPAVVDAGARGTTGIPLSFDFSSDWSGLNKYVAFFTSRGLSIEVPYIGGDINIPAEIMQVGGPYRYNVVGTEIDGSVVTRRLEVSGELRVSYTPGDNPRLLGRLTPSTLDLFLAQAEANLATMIQNVVDSGELQGPPGEAAGFANPTARAVTLPYTDDATVIVTANGPDNAKQFDFVFGIPRGEDAPDGLAKGPDGKVYLMRGSQIVGGGVDITGDPGRNFTILGTYATLDALEAAVTDPDVGDAYGVGSSESYDVYVYDGVSEDWVNYGSVGMTVDVAMSDSSTNPVQNKIVKAYIDGLIGDLDTAITAIEAIVGGVT